MRILIDALSAREGGGITYIKHILPTLVELQTNHEFVILFSSQYQQDLIVSTPDRIQVVTVDLPPEPLSKRWWYLQTGLVKLIKDLHIDLFFAPAESSYLCKPVPFVMLSRNLSIYTTPSIANNQKAALIKYRLARQIPVFLSMQRADQILFVSETLRQQVIQQLWLNQKKTRVVYHGVSPIFFEPSTPLTGLPTDQPYFLMVSSINPHKNYETLIRAFAKLPQDAPHLIIAGKVLNAPTYAMLQDIVLQEKLENRVHFLGQVSYDNLPALYRESIASIMASRLETFGHPLVEAMAAQTPVIASDLPICKEICGDAALYFNPDSADTLAEHMQAVWQDAVLRERMITAGRQRAANFSWRRSAQQLVAVFDELC
jgi:glycosyltransferase involved in cell wall biosynthesis